MHTNTKHLENKYPDAFIFSKEFGCKKRKMLGNVDFTRIASIL